MNLDLINYSVSIFNTHYEQVYFRYIEVISVNKIKIPVLIEFTCQCEAVDNKYINNIILLNNRRCKIHWTIMINNLIKPIECFLFVTYLIKTDLLVKLRCRM